MNALYIDVGSTDIKFRTDGEKESRKVPFPMTRAQEPFFEADAEQIFQTIADIIARSPSAENILLSVQMHGYILRMRQGGDSAYVSWRDSRAREMFAAGEYERTLLPMSGTSYKANLAPVSLQYRQQAEGLDLSDILEFYTLGSYLAFRLTGRNVTHITDAAATGFFDVHGKSACGCGFRLPEALLRVLPVGMYAGRRVFAPVGDQQAAIASLPEKVLRECYILNLGTAAQLCCVGDEYLSFGESCLECRPFFGGRYLYTVTGLPGGDWFRSHSMQPSAEVWLAQRYAQAIEKLPRRSALAVIGGGVAVHYAQLLQDALFRLGIGYQMASADAADGLGNIMRKEHEKRNRDHDQ